MYCPICGGELTEVVRKDPFEDMDIDDPRWDDMDSVEFDEDDQSVWFKCTHCQSFGADYPLVMHHPLSLRGSNNCRPGEANLKSRPGDSWSLTWLK